jgi:hypothetical protein
MLKKMYALNDEKRGKIKADGKFIKRNCGDKNVCKILSRENKKLKWY